jgi:hypothetical protein
MTWHTLPARPLKGVDTPMVESLFSWAAMQCQTIGTTPRAFLMMLDQTRSSASYFPSLLTGPGPTFLRHISSLSHLCNSPHLRCGTFYVVANIAGKNFHGRRSQMHKWCPLCLAGPTRELYLPLLFSLSSVSRCPVHGCNLLEKCPRCRAQQRLSWESRKWSSCSYCKTSLALDPVYGTGTIDANWCDRQSADLIALCADPQRDQIVPDAYLHFVEELVAQSRVESAIGYRTRIKKYYLSASFRPYFKVLLQMCASQGTGVVDMLLNPKESASPRLFP